MWRWCRKILDAQEKGHSRDSPLAWIQTLGPMMGNSTWNAARCSGGRICSNREALRRVVWKRLRRLLGDLRGLGAVAQTHEGRTMRLLGLRWLAHLLLDMRFNSRGAGNWYIGDTTLDIWPMAFGGSFAPMQVISASFTSVSNLRSTAEERGC